MSLLPKPKLGSLKPPSAPKLSTGSTAPKPPSVSSPMKVGTQATVKMPKAKKMADPFGKPSLFFKSEDFGTIKRPSIEKLRAFLEKTRLKK